MIFQNYFNAWQQLSTIGRENWTLASSLFVNRLGHMALPFLLLYLTRERSFSPAQAGFMLTVYGVCGLLGAIGSGFLSDRFSPVIIMRGSLFLTAISIGIYPFVESRVLMYCVAGIWAIGAESFRPANATLLNLITPKEKRKLAFSLHRFAVNLGMSVGPAFGGLIAEFSFRWIFYINAVALILGQLVLSRLPSRLGRLPKTDLSPEHQLTHMPTSEMRAYKDGSYILFLIGMLFVICVFLQQDGVQGLYMTRDLNMLPRYYGLMFAVNTLLIVFFEIPLNVKTSRWSHRRCLVMGALIHAVAFGLFTWATGLVTIAALVALNAVGEMIESPATHASVGDRASRARMGEYLGLLTMTYNMGNALGPWLGTLIYQNYGAQMVWLACLVVGSLGALIFWRLPWLDAKPTLQAAKGV